MGAKHSASRKKLSIRVATWNLGNVCPTTGFSFLHADGPDPDIVAVGVQEAVYEARKGHVDMEMDLFLSLHKQLGEDKYENVWQQSLTPRTDKTYRSKEAFLKAYKDHPETMSMSGIRLVVFAKKSLAGEGFMPEDIECKVQTCGKLDGISGNKGAVCVTCRFGDVWVSFLTAHLNAHTEYLERRIADFETIMFGLHAQSDDLGERETYISTESLDFREYVKNVEVGNRCHVMIAFGDFNFRLDPLGPDGKSLPLNEQCATVLKCVDAEQWADLAKYDQLLREQAKRRCFHNFVELNGHPMWAPTFKLKSGPEEEGGGGGGGGGDEADASASASVYNLKRCPSWCDRVLFKTGHGGRCESLRYIAHHDYAPNTSDHVPVTADFTVDVWNTSHYGHRHNAAKTAASRLFKSMSLHKERSIRFDNVRFIPDHSFVMATYAEADEGPQATLAKAGIIVTAFHSTAPDRVKTTTQAYSEKEMHWAEPLELKTRASVEDILRYPIVLCVRNVASDKNRLHRMGEAMIDIRVLAELHADPHKTLKMPICGSARVEVLQRGTPRGFVEFDYTINKKEK